MTESFFDRINKNKTMHTPDVLSCLANLSNDEVFTPPEVVNKMLDMLPQELFTNPNTTFLDPACKTGVFLREIAKRLLVGLEDQIPDLQQRIDHILHKQLFGIAITELTSLLSRRSVYCSKYPNGKYSVSQFTDSEGNIRFKKTQHTWDTKTLMYDENGKKIGKCIYCGALRNEYDRAAQLETHAYEFIHTDKLEKLFNMKFDVIIGNPPYQLGAKKGDKDNDLHKTSDQPIYHLFVEQAIKLQPRYLTMIIPSRWMFGGKGLNDFRNTMLSDKHITVLHDFIDSTDCFTGVSIKGGVCYFLREKDRTAPCKITTYTKDAVKESVRYLQEENIDVFVRQPELLAIKNKVWKDQTQLSFATIVSGQTPFGLYSNLFSPNSQQKGVLTELLSTTPIDNGYEILGLDGNKKAWRYVPKNYPFPICDGLTKYKVFIPSAYGSGAIGEAPSTPVLGTPVQACTQTFIRVGAFDTELESINALKYIRTKFFRCRVSIVKQSQHANNRVYQYVPLQLFTQNSDIIWEQSVEEIDQQLYAKYNLDENDIAFIESNISPMDGGNE